MPTKIRHTGGLLFVLLLVLSLSLSGCRLTYLLHAAVGQAKLLSGAVPMEQGLNETVLGAEEKERLHLVPRIKVFGEEVLGLKRTNNYETVYLASPSPPLYVVSACPRDRLVPVTWWFPIVGRMPYLGFFDLDKARAEKNRLIEKDLDVSLGSAAAYSTLGWFRDPVTLNMIEESTLDLVEIILHEMTHTTLYIKGQGAFNEGLASLVGKVGAQVFFENLHGPAHPLTMEAGDALDDERLIASYMDCLLKGLEILYALPLPYDEKMARREEIFSEALKEFEGLKPRLKTDRFRTLGHVPLNNAYLATVGLYHRHFHLFEQMLRKNGNDIKENLDYLQRLAEGGGDMLERMYEFSCLKEPGNCGHGSLFSKTKGHGKD